MASEGIPPQTFVPVEGDSWTTCSEIKEVLRELERVRTENTALKLVMRKLKEKADDWDNHELHFDCEESMYSYIECDGQYEVVEK
tara:strand:- start:962 stop:1216 length:255 start_codon:yes stop_codon:yes gene_type:complete